jgi:hypothetical protein
LQSSEYHKRAEFMAINKRDLVSGGLASSVLALGHLPTFASAKPMRSRPSSYALARGEEVWALLETTPYVQVGTSSRILYDVGYRACTPCMLFARMGVAECVRAGFSVRSFVFAPKSNKRPTLNASNGEMASVAEVYRSRSADFLDAWYRSSSVEGFARSRGLPDYASNTAGQAAVAAGRDKLKTLADILDADLTGINWGYPTFIWRGQSGIRATFGYGTSGVLLAAMRRA